MIVVRFWPSATPHVLGTEYTAAAVAHCYKDGSVRFRKPYSDALQADSWHTDKADAWRDLPAPGGAVECPIPRLDLGRHYR